MGFQGNLKTFLFSKVLLYNRCSFYSIEEENEDEDDDMGSTLSTLSEEKNKDEKEEVEEVQVYLNY